MRERRRPLSLAAAGRPLAGRRQWPSGPCRRHRARRLRPAARRGAAPPARAPTCDDSVAQEIATSATYADAALTVIAPTLPPPAARSARNAARADHARQRPYARADRGAARPQSAGRRPAAGGDGLRARGRPAGTRRRCRRPARRPAGRRGSGRRAGEAMEYVLREALRNVESAGARQRSGRVRVRSTERCRSRSLTTVAGSRWARSTTTAATTGSWECRAAGRRGGDLTVHSAPGEGTTLAAVIPRR